MLVDTANTSVATEISILDNVIVGLTTASKNLTVHGNATDGGALKPVGDFTVGATRSDVVFAISAEHRTTK